MKEHAVQNHIRLEAARLGIDLWRNNVGVLTDERGVPVRYGLANDSSNINKTIKSSDLIGITPVVIPQSWVGCLVGVFTAVEVKESGWTFNPSRERDLAQLKFHDIVRKNGGFAGFATGVDDFKRIVGR